MSLVSRRNFLKKVGLLSTTLILGNRTARALSDMNMKVIVNYSNFADRMPEDRSIEEAVKIVLECNPDYIFRGFPSGGRPIPENDASAYEQLVNCGYSEEEAKKFSQFLIRYGLTYSNLKKVVDLIKSENPNIIFSVTEHTQYVYKHVWDPITLEPIANTTDMAMDFSKWDLINPENRKKFDLATTQIFCAKNMGIRMEELVFNGGGRYIADITSEEYQNWIVNRLKRYTELGVDAVQFDILFGHARVAYTVVKWMKEHGYYDGDPLYHPTVVELYNAACDIVEKAKSLGLRVGTWFGLLMYAPYKRMPKLDETYISPTYNEIIKISFDDGRWDRFINEAKNKLGDVDLYSFIDNGGLDSYPMHALSQKLTPEQQKSFFIKWDNYMRSKGIIPVYPIHDGVMGKTITRKSFGKYPIYDATAPEFNTYSTLKDLALKAKGLKERRVPSVGIHQVVIALVIAALIYTHIFKGKSKNKK